MKLPMTERSSFQARTEDMSNKGVLSLFKQKDGDIVVTATGENGNTASVEFCTAGGRYPETLGALNLLFEATEKDNQPSAQSFAPISFLSKPQT